MSSLEECLSQIASLIATGAPGNLRSHSSFAELVSLIEADPLVRTSLGTKFTLGGLSTRPSAHGLAMSMLGSLETGEASVAETISTYSSIFNTRTVEVILRLPLYDYSGPDEVALNDVLRIAPASQFAQQMGRVGSLGREDAGRYVLDLLRFDGQFA